MEIICSICMIVILRALVPGKMKNKIKLNEIK